jgi:tetratricopeptide (TPR) repeat protein
MPMPSHAPLTSPAARGRRRIIAAAAIALAILLAGNHAVRAQDAEATPEPAATTEPVVAPTQDGQPIPEPKPGPEPDLFRDVDQRYTNCMAMARSDPAVGENEAVTWFGLGGGPAAEHCRSVALIGLGRYAEAGALLEKLAGELPQTETTTIADLFGQAAQAWMLEGSYDRAIADINQSILLAPGDVEFVIDRALALASSGQYWEAIDDLNTAAEMAPGRTDILVLRGTAYRFVEAPELALEDIVRVLEIEPQNPDALFERGMLYALAGDIESARADWQQVVTIAPGSSVAEAAKANLEATAAP